MIGWNIIGRSNLYSFRQRAFPKLLGWALGSMGSGIMWMRNQNGTVAGFGSQFVGWGAMNAILTALGLKQRKAQPGATGAGEISAEWLSCQTKNFERLILLKAGLDAVYIAAGAWLATQPPKQGDKIKDRCGSFRSRIGLGIIAQETFLLIGVIMRSLLVHRGGMHDIP